MVESRLQRTWCRSPSLFHQENLPAKRNLEAQRAVFSCRRHSALCRVWLVVLSVFSNFSIICRCAFYRPKFQNISGGTKFSCAFPSCPIPSYHILSQELLGMDTCSFVDISVPTQGRAFILLYSKTLDNRIW